MTNTQDINRSYQIRRTLPIGSTAVVTQGIERNRPIKPADWDGPWERVTVFVGEPVQVVRYTNAGFRGIEATVRLMDGTLLHGLSAGLLDPA